MVVFGIDLETHSPVELRTHGARVYAEHPDTRCLMACWHLVGAPEAIGLWLEGDPIPQVLVDHIAQGGLFSGWNICFFDRLIWDNILVPRHGFPSLPADSWIDSMHRAAAMNKPRSLAGCAKDLGVPFTDSLKDNNRIRRITSAKRTVIPGTVASILDGRTPAPSKLLAGLTWLRDRCVQDVAMEEAVLQKLEPWPQVAPWVRMPAIDRRINDRGVLLDVVLIDGLARAAAQEMTRINAALNTLTKGRVPRVTNTEALKGWLVENGVELPRAHEPVAEDEPEDEAAEKTDTKSLWRLRKSDLADLIARTDIPEHCHQALMYRFEAGKASVSKLKGMRARVSADGRLRDAFVLMGAQATGRWSSAGAQLQNLVRDVFANPDEIAGQHGLNSKTDHARVQALSEQALNTAIEVGRLGDADMIRALYEVKRLDLQGRETTQGVLSWISRMGRRILSAGEGQRLLNGDYANIEARIPVWLAGQNDVVEAFARGEDVYRMQASPVYGIPPEQLNKQQRQIGKVMTLFLGFGGGVNAFVPAAMNYGVTISRNEGLVYVKKFRDTNTALVNYWNNGLNAAKAAVCSPGHEFFVEPTGLISWRMNEDNTCLLCRLPSGRDLHYWAPQLEQGYWENRQPKRELDLTVLVVKGKVVLRRTLWRGLIIENACQSIAADILGTALDNFDRNGLPVIGHFHDAVAAEVDEDEVDRMMPVFEACLLDQPGWTKGLPLAIDCDDGARFG